MISNIDKYKKDVEELVSKGEILFHIMGIQFLPEQYNPILKKKYGSKKELDKFLNSLSDFRSEYQGWYSEALVLLKQLLPDRLDDFIYYYKKPKTRKNISSENYVIEDALQGLNITRNGEEIVGPGDAIPHFRQQLSIIKSVQRRFESSLFDIKQLVQADVFDNELDAAKELNKKGFTRAAGAVAGVVLEGHLKQVCENHKIKVKKNRSGINDFAELLKKSDVIEIPEWRKIQHLADLRNLCDHNKDTDPSKGDIDELIVGVDKFIKTLS